MRDSTGGIRTQIIRRRWALALGCVGFGFTLAHADLPDDRLAANTGDLKKLSLEDLANVEVTSVSRHPQRLQSSASAIQVITAEDIRRSGATSLPEALKLADNLDVVRRNAHDWSITARGFNTQLANKLLVLIDGRTVYTPLFSGVFWDQQDYLLADIERIEVISGPGGTQWGANAVNGVINIITKTAKDTQGVYAEASAGNQLHDRVAARYGGSAGADAYFRVYAQQTDRGSESLGNGSGAHDGWNRQQAGFRWDRTWSPSASLTVQGDYYDGNENVTTGNTEAVHGGNLLARWTQSTAGNGEMSLQAYASNTHLYDPIPAFVLGGHAISAAGFFTEDLDTYDVDFQHRFHLGERNLIQWGVGYRYTHDHVINTPTLAFLPTTLNQSLYSAFLQDEFALAPTLTLTAGSKIEHNGYTGTELEPSVRLAWNASEYQSVWAAVSRAVRTPSRIDRDFSEPALGSPLVILVGSPAFVAETVVADELGYRAQFNDRVAGSVSLFHNDYLHIRSTQFSPGGAFPLVFANDVEGTTEGLELALDWQARDNWRLHAGYAPLIEHLHVKPGAFDFNQAHNEVADPHDRFSLRSSVDLPHGLEFDAGLRYTAPRPMNSGPVVSDVKSYWDLDLRLGWHATEHLELSLDGQNLLYAHRAQYGYPDAAQVLIERAAYGKVVWHF